MIADFRKQNSRVFLNKAKSPKLQETHRKYKREIKFPKSLG